MNVKKGPVIRLKDADSGARNAQVNVVNINEGNKQIAHGIDRVMRPIKLSK